MRLDYIYIYIYDICIDCVGIILVKFETNLKIFSTEYFSLKLKILGWFHSYETQCTAVR